MRWKHLLYIYPSFYPFYTLMVFLGSARDYPCTHPRVKSAWTPVQHSNNLQTSLMCILLDLKPECVDNWKTSHRDFLGLSRTLLVWGDSAYHFIMFHIILHNTGFGDSQNFYTLPTFIDCNVSLYYSFAFFVVSSTLINDIYIKISQERKTKQTK